MWRSETTAPHIDAARERLGKQQAALVRAVTLGERSPPGFDERRIRALATSLVRKRLRAVARVWPAVSESLGPDLLSTFEEYAARSPLPAEGGALADGMAFLRWLAKWSLLNDRLRRQLLACELEYRLTEHGPRRRRGLAVKWVWLAESRRLLVGLRLRSWSGTITTWPMPWRRRGPRGSRVVVQSRSAQKQSSSKKQASPLDIGQPSHE